MARKTGQVKSRFAYSAGSGRFVLTVPGSIDIAQTLERHKIRKWRLTWQGPQELLSQETQIRCNECDASFTDEIGGSTCLKSTRTTRDLEVQDMGTIYGERQSTVRQGEVEGSKTDIFKQDAPRRPITRPTPFAIRFHRAMSIFPKNGNLSAVLKSSY